MTDDPRRRYGRAARVSATSEYADTSSASANPSRDVSTKLPARSSRFAKASAWTSTSSRSCVSPQRANTRAMSSSDWTSAGSTNVEPIEVASGRTRFSIRLSIDEKPTSAPFVVQRPGDPPGDRVVVRDPEDQRVLAVEQAHLVLRFAARA